MSDETKYLDSVTLEHYLAGDATDEELHCVNEWAATHPDRRTELDRLVKALGRGAGEQKAWHRETRWETLRAEITGRRTRGYVPSRAPGRPALRSGLLIGAALAILAALGISRVLVSPPSDRGSYRTYTTRVAERATIKLADGSRVTLNAASTIRVPTSFGKSARTVQVDGQAQFEVAHTEGKPFVVEMGAARVTVLGTSFIVRKYGSDQRTRIAVVDGRVAVQSLNGRERHPAILSANSVAEITDSGATTVKSDTDVAADIGWTTGKLVFRDTPLRDALPDIERRYNVEIRISAASLEREALTATLDQEDESSAIKLLALALNVRFERQGRVITLLPPHAPPTLRRKPFPPSQEVFHGR